MNFNREKLLSHIGDQDAKQALVKVLDKAENVLSRHSVESGDFLDPYHLDLAKGIVRGMDLEFLDWGGFPDAERRKLVLGPAFRDLRPQDAGIAVLRVEAGSGFQTLSHRDYLGSLLGMGFKREKLGDIICKPDRAWVALDAGMADYVVQNLARVGKTPVRVREAGKDEVDLPQEEFKEINATVPSLRLDAVAGEGFSLSRSKIAAEIEAGKVKVNWRPVTELSFQIKQADVISCRGLGRIVITEVRGQTKKGRTALLIHRLV